MQQNPRHFCLSRKDDGNTQTCQCKSQLMTLVSRVQHKSNGISHRRDGAVVLHKSIRWVTRDHNKENLGNMHQKIGRQNTLHPKPHMHTLLHPHLGKSWPQSMVQGCSLMYFPHPPGAGYLCVERIITRMEPAVCKPRWHPESLNCRRICIGLVYKMRVQAGDVVLPKRAKFFSHQEKRP